jgi:hypothetical protein
MSGSVPPELVDLLAIVRGYQRSRAVTVAAELGLADLLSSGPRGLADLAAATSTDPSSLYRLLRALAAVGVFIEHPDRRFGLSAMGELLRRDHPLSLDPAARMFGADYQWRAWGELRHSVETGENAAVHALVRTCGSTDACIPSRARSSTRRCGLYRRGTTPVCSLPMTSGGIG